MATEAPKVARLNSKQLERGLYKDGEPPSTGLEIGDPRLDSITDAAFKSNYLESAGLAHELWSSGVRDIRILGYLLYGHFADRNIAALAWDFEQVTTTLTAKWDELGPAKKEKPGDNALTWYFQTLIRQLSGHEKVKDVAYQTWMEDAGAAAFAAAIAAAGPLVAALEQRFPTGKSLDKFRNLSNWLTETQRSIQDAVNERQYAAARAAAEAAAAEEAAKQAAENKAARQANGEPASFISADGVSIEGGAAMALLMRKIRLFEQLIEKQELQKAAVVARDVDMLVQHFDPITFLPKVFVPFFRLMSRNMQHLEPAMAALDMPLFKSLVQLYHADLDAFAES